MFATRLAAIAVADELQISSDAIVQSLRDFEGIDRRFQRMGEVKTVSGQGDAGRRLRASPDGNRGHDFGCPVRMARTAHRAGVSAASLLAHARPYGRLCQRAVRRRRAGSCSMSTPPAKRRSPTQTVGRWRAPFAPADRSSRSLSSRLDELQPVLLDLVIGEGDLVLTMGAGDIGAYAAGLPDLLRERTGAEGAEMMAPAQHIGTAGEMRFDEPMSRHTSWRAGGPGRTVLHSRQRRPISPSFSRISMPTRRFSGTGSAANLFVRDGGIPGVVISAAKMLTRPRQAGSSIVVAAGAGRAVHTAGSAMPAVGPRAVGVLRGHSRHRRRCPGDECRCSRRRDLGTGRVRAQYRPQRRNSPARSPDEYSGCLSQRQRPGSTSGFSVQTCVSIRTSTPSREVLDGMLERRKRTRNRSGCRAVAPCSAIRTAITRRRLDRGGRPEGLPDRWS